MAISYTAHRGTANTLTDNTAVSMSPSAALAVGKLIVVRTYSRGQTSHTVTDSKGNTWTKVEEIQGATGSTKTLALHYTTVTTEIGTGDTITLTLGASQTGKVIAAEEFATGGGAISVAGSSSAEGNSGTPAVTLSGLSSVTRMWVGVLGVSQAKNFYGYTQDADYANDTKVGTDTGSQAAASDVGTRSSANTSDTFNPTITSNPWGIILAAFEEAQNVTVTPTTAALTTAVFAPKIATKATPSTLALVLTGYTPVLAGAIIPSTATLLLTTFAPFIGNQTAVPGTASLVLATFAPQIHTAATPAPAGLTLTLFAPVLAAGIIPGTQSLILTTYAFVSIRPILSRGEARYAVAAAGDGKF